jgi:hypothetical protein
MVTTTTIIYNTTAIQHSQSAYAFVKAVNSASSGMFFNLTVVTIFIILLAVSMKYTDFLGALMGASWIMFILTVGLSIAQLVNIIFPLGFLIIAGFSTMYHQTQQT